MLRKRYVINTYRNLRGQIQALLSIRQNIIFQKNTSEIVILGWAKGFVGSDTRRGR